MEKERKFKEIVSHKGKKWKKQRLIWSVRVQTFRFSAIQLFGKVKSSLHWIWHQSKWGLFFLLASGCSETQLNFKAVLQSHLPAIWTPHNSTSHCGSCRVNSVRLPPQFSSPAQHTGWVWSQQSSRGDKCCYCLFPDLYSSWNSVDWFHDLSCRCKWKKIKKTKLRKYILATWMDRWYERGPFTGLMARCWW